MTFSQDPKKSTRNFIIGIPKKLSLFCCESKKMPEIKP